MNTLATRYHDTLIRIKQACLNNSVNSQKVQLLAVSKTKPLEDIYQLHQLGQIHFGENYVQEGVEKAIQAKADNKPLIWHFIGPLQSNKTKQIAEYFDWCHSIERQKIAARLDAQRPSHLPPLNVLIQVNISNEQSKSGVQFSEVAELAKAINEKTNLTLRGLMAIGSASSDSKVIEQEFTALQAAFESLKSTYPQIDTLSLGMSGDLDLAIKHGSSMVRIGSALFGAREKREQQ